MKKKFLFTIHIFKKLKNYVKFNKKKQMKLEIQNKWKKNFKIIYNRFNDH